MSVSLSVFSSALVATNLSWAGSLPFIVAAVGIVSLLVTWLTHQQRAIFDMIDDVYSLCHKLHGHLLNEWRLTHLFCIDRTGYTHARTRIESTLDHTDVQSLNQLIEKERLFAIHVFIVYEQAYYHWRETSLLFRRRRRFLREMLSYFTERLLQNPRLVAYLKSDPVGRSLHLEEESRLFLEEPLRTCHLDADETGPFGHHIPPVQGTPRVPSAYLRWLWRSARRQGRARLK